MTRVLEAWLDDEHIGRFERADDGVVTFSYDGDAPQTPISLSLPRDGSATKKGAENFLENILPDHEVTRARMASAYGSKSPATFDLLSVAGGDIAGGLVLLPDGQSPVPAGRAELNPALTADVAGRISSIKRDPDYFSPEETPARFSLAGTQGKFALASVDGDWYWSNATLPSTHIVKPGRGDLPGIEAVEAAALGLASRAGVPAPVAAVLNVEDQTAFIVERFDRVAHGGSIPRRLHAEDLAQSLGIGPGSKYHVSAKQAAEIIRTVDSDGSILRAFLHQLSYNTVIGNADAHAKNYSLLLSTDGVRLAPLYDAVPVMLYPQFNQGLAMRIAGGRRAQAVGPDHWRKLARKIDFDSDEMTAIVSAVAAGVAEHNDSVWSEVPPVLSAQVRDGVARNVDAMLGASRPRTSRPAHAVAPNGSGGVQRRRTTAASTAGAFAPKVNSAPDSELSPPVGSETN